MDSRKRVFISHSRESGKCDPRVVEFGQRLEAEGFQVEGDFFEGMPPEGWSIWTKRQLEQADMVVCVHTQRYIDIWNGDADPTTGGRGTTIEIQWVRHTENGESRLNRKAIAVYFDNRVSIRIDPQFSETAALHATDDFDQIVRSLQRRPEVQRQHRAQAVADRASVAERTVDGLVLRLDRTDQWRDLRDLVSAGRTGVCLVHGSQKQNVPAFLERVRQSVGSPSLGGNAHYTWRQRTIVARRGQLAMPRSLAQWHDSLEAQLGVHGDSIPALLRRWLGDSAGLLTVGPFECPLHEPVERAAFDLLGELTKLCRYHPGKPLYLLVEFHHDAGEDALIRQFERRLLRSGFAPALAEGVEQPVALRLTELHAPPLYDIERSLLALGYRPEQIDLVIAAWDGIKHLPFTSLAEEIAELLRDPIRVRS